VASANHAATLHATRSQSHLASYTPGSGSAYNSSSSSAVAVVKQAAGRATATAVLSTADGSSSYFDYTGAVTFNITVTGSGTPTGIVTLFADGQLLGTATPSGGGQWSYVADSSTTQDGFLPLPVGTDVVTAQYSGDSANADTSASIPITILDNSLLPDFGLVSNLTYQAVSSGTTSTNFILQVEQINNLTQPINLSWTTPNGITCVKGSQSSGTGTGTSVTFGTLPFVRFNFTCSNLPTVSGRYVVLVRATSSVVSQAVPGLTTSIVHDIPLKIMIN
jgi:hypothetical protein